MGYGSLTGATTEPGRPSSLAVGFFSSDMKKPRTLYGIVTSQKPTARRGGKATWEIK